MPKVIQFPNRPKRVKFIDNTFRSLIDSLKIENPALIKDLNEKRAEMAAIIVKHEISNNITVTFSLCLPESLSLSPDKIRVLMEAIQSMTERYNHILFDILVELTNSKIKECFIKHGMHRD